MKKIRLIEVKSELGAGTRGASLGIDALKIACLNKQSDYFKRFTAVEVPNLNDVLFEKNLFPHAKYIDSVLQTYKRISNTVEQTLELGMFPLLLAGDHSNAGGTIAGIKAAFPDKTLGVIWVDAHADIHSPYTTPSGNMHGMPLAASLSEDNLECKVNEPDPETVFFWEALKKVGTDQPKIKHQHIVYIVTRSYEKPEVYLFDKHNIKNFTYPEVIAKGIEQVAEEALNRLRDCDLIYVSFDVDSLDSKFSKGTGTPVEVGLNVAQAKELCYHLVSHPKVICFEMVEINPTLDAENTMAQNAFEILEHTTDAIQNRLAKEAQTVSLA
ncbi:arginase [Rufibacter latericius]|uniref:Arginase n=1 Tax=Rufibacter latericius TaxID=2487040 RepID=A0A3M9MUZ5_9BACT|nr:arginase [Rufibacter latericius]RNI29330.1 arginase [Rufibacter latericius]